MIRNSMQQRSGLMPSGRNQSCPARPGQIFGLLALLLVAPLLSQGYSEANGSSIGGADFGVPLATPALSREAFEVATIARLPLLDNQRYMPLDTAARNWVRLITGKETFKKTHPVSVLLHWMLEPDVARKEAWFEIPKREAAEILGLPLRTPERQHLSYDWLLENRGWAEAADKLRTRQANGENLGLVELEALRVLHRVNLFHALMGLESGTGKSPDRPWRGHFPAIPPKSQPAPGYAYYWFSPAQATIGDPENNEAPWSTAEFAPVQKALEALAVAWKVNDPQGFQTASSQVLAAVQALGYPQPIPGLSLTDPKNKLAFPGMAMIDREVRYNRLQPFVNSKFGYLTAVLLFGLALAFRNAFGRILWFKACLVLLASTAFHAFGLFERTVISQRAMIGNLYESIIYATACAALVGFGTEIFSRRRWFGLSGALFAFIGLYSGVLAPDFLRPEISNLQPVLINNDLIHIHVPTIMLSYVILGLGAIAAHVWLIGWWFQGRKSAKAVAPQAPGGSHGAWFQTRARTADQILMSQYISWMTAVGVILLFIGIILGGVWADMSWGRFWGWDSKETSSLILWLWFVALIHGRWAGWLRDLGVAVGTVLGGVLMMWTWIGTNLFLRGLHSYAGTAGEEIAVPLWVYLYAAGELGIIAVSLVLLHFRRDSEALWSKATAEGAAGGTPVTGQG